MATENLDFDVIKPVRSGLLTVLCIFSILGGVYRLASGSVALSTASSFAEAQKGIQKSKERMQEEKIKNPNARGNAFAEKMVLEAGSIVNEDYIRKNAFISMGTALITILGAILMFRLNRLGFWVYLAGTIAEIALPLLLFGPNLFTGISTTITGFFGLVFVVLYAFCLKEMKPAPVSAG
jgi:hypothetical protein